MESSRPSGYLDNLGRGRHVVLFYDAPEYARRLEFRFLMTGLARNEDCFYLTNVKADTETVRGKMMNIPALRDGIERNHPKIVSDKSVPQNPWEVPSLFEDRQRGWMRGTSNPTRVVGVTVPHIESREHLETQLEVESYITRLKGDFMTVLCSLYIESVFEDLKGDWFRRMVASHQGALFAPPDGRESHSILDELQLDRFP